MSVQNETSAIISARLTAGPDDYVCDDYVRWIRQRVGSRKIFLVFGTVFLRDEKGRIPAVPWSSAKMSSRAPGASYGRRQGWWPVH